MKIWVSIGATVGRIRAIILEHTLSIPTAVDEMEKKELRTSATETGLKSKIGIRGTDRLEILSNVAVFDESLSDTGGREKCLLRAHKSVSLTEETGVLPMPTDLRNLQV